MKETDFFNIGNDNMKHISKPQFEQGAVDKLCKAERRGRGVKKSLCFLRRGRGYLRHALCTASFLPNSTIIDYLPTF